MVYTFVQQENPVFCFISREKILPICLGPETKFSREFQHKSYLNPKLVIVTQTNSTKLYLYKTLLYFYFIKNLFLGVSCEVWIFWYSLDRHQLFSLVNSISTYFQYYISVKKKNSILLFDICQKQLLLCKSPKGRALNTI